MSRTGSQSAAAAARRSSQDPCAHSARPLPAPGSRRCPTAGAPSPRLRGRASARRWRARAARPARSHRPRRAAGRGRSPRRRRGTPRRRRWVPPARRAPPNAAAARRRTPAPPRDPARCSRAAPAGPSARADRAPGRRARGARRRSPRPWSCQRSQILMCSPIRSTIASSRPSGTACATSISGLSASQKQSNLHDVQLVEAEGPRPARVGLQEERRAPDQRRHVLRVGPEADVAMAVCRPEPRRDTCGWHVGQLRRLRGRERSTGRAARWARAPRRRGRAVRRPPGRAVASARAATVVLLTPPFPVTKAIRRARTASTVAEAGAARQAG